MAKKKRNKVVGMIALVILVLAIIFNSQQGGVETFSTLQTEPEVLDFCSTKSSCIDALNRLDMPENFLSENKLEIICTNGRCIIKEK